jgi:peroxiredoxin
MELGAKAADFGGLKGVDGRTYGLADFAGKDVLVVVFSCNHCPYVQAYEGRMVDLQARYGGRGVQLVAINSNEDVGHPEDSFEEMVKRAKAEGFNFPYLRDASQAVARAYGATHTPHLFVFGKDRTLAYTGKIDDDWQDPKAVKERFLERALEELLAGKPVSTPKTHAVGCTIKWAR